MTIPHDRTGSAHAPEGSYSTSADDPGTLSVQRRLTDVRVRLALREFEAAMNILDDLEPDVGTDAIWYAARGWALAGRGQFDEAREMLTRAELHAARSRWVMKQVLLDAQVGVAGLKREHTERAKARPRRTKTRPRTTSARPTAIPSTHRPAPPVPVDGPEVPLRFALVRAEAPDEPGGAPADAATALADYRRRAVAVEIDQLRRYDTLLSLAAARGVDHYEYQLRTVRRGLRDFHGRALLADEVGLGKTVEACLCLEEYFQRGLARRALLLVPPGLVEQWRDELAGKFGREARIVTGPEARRDPETWRQGPLVLTSMALARSQPHAQRIAESGFDMVVVDEAHRLKNERTLLWQLVDRIRARYLLLLSATPVENDLLEIYNVLSLLRPGLFSTQADFKRRFVAAGRRTPKDPVALRALLRQVMIRNTRAVADARLPPRFATTLRATSTDEERAFRTDLDAAIRERLAEGTLSRALVGELLRAAGARPPAAARLIERHLGATLGTQARELRRSSKDALLADLLGRSDDDKVIVFASHRDSVEHVAEVVAEAGRRPVVFHGSLSAADKAATVAAFRDRADVLVATDSGGEGFNLHFARTVVNYDLPWNPMRIEQRIGRVHRIGQERDVFVFNLVADGTIEEEILRVLDEKIDMFELVVGEVEAILGRLGDDEREFSDLVLEIYAETGDAAAMRARFDALAETMLDARRRHLKTIEFENQVFGRDLEA